MGLRNRSEYAEKYAHLPVIALKIIVGEACVICGTRLMNAETLCLNVFKNITFDKNECIYSKC